MEEGGEGPPLTASKIAIQASKGCRGCIMCMCRCVL
jgi:hypothetical protein